MRNDIIGSQKQVALIIYLDTGSVLLAIDSHVGYLHFIPET